MSIFNWKRKTALETTIDSALKSMSVLEPESKEYAAIASTVGTLYEAKGHEPNRRISWDTVAVILGNLLGIILILTYEQVNVITTKALNFIIKGRV